MLADYVKTTYICSTQQLHDNSLPLIPTPPLIMAVNIGAAECRPLPSDPPWDAASSRIQAETLLEGRMSHGLSGDTRLLWWWREAGICYLCRCRCWRWSPECGRRCPWPSHGLLGLPPSHFLGREHHQPPLNISHKN